MILPQPATSTERDDVKLADRGIGLEQAADLRRRLLAFVEDWDRRDMDVYDAL